MIGQSATSLQPVYTFPLQICSCQPATFTPFYNLTYLYVLYPEFCWIGFQLLNTASTFSHGCNDSTDSQSTQFHISHGFLFH